MGERSLERLERGEGLLNRGLGHKKKEGRKKIVKENKWTLLAISLFFPDRLETSPSHVDKTRRKT